MNDIKGISLFAGAGGMDVGFKNAGVEVIVANEIDKFALQTYQLNHPTTELLRGDINDYIAEFEKYDNIDLVFGGPPCQGFSVAGKMNPNDERSQNIWRFLDVVEKSKPKAFVMENVKALATLSKWEDIRVSFVEKAESLGYCCKYVVLNASDFGVTQNRERVFFIGSKRKYDIESLNKQFESKKCSPKTIRQLFSQLPSAGTEGNELTCTAKITFASNPVLRKSPYAGMLFNGMGRPINLEGVCSTLPASMGGNKTPIIDNNLLNKPNSIDWIVKYHEDLRNNTITPEYGIAPRFLRRLTIAEVALIQSFPHDYKFAGSKSAIYTQIGNAVPCSLAEVVARVVIENCI